MHAERDEGANMSRGDHIFVERAGYTRHGIDVGDGRVIHIRGEPGMSKVDAGIRFASLQEFSQGGEVNVRNYDQRFGPDEAVARAESKVGAPDQQLFGRHGEFFASWCVAGSNTRAQISGAVAGVGREAGTAPAAVAVVARGRGQGLGGVGIRADRSGRTWSLQREWSRGFTVMLVLLLAAAAATIVGGGRLVSEMQRTANQLHVESDTVAELRVELHEQEQLGHKLLSNQPVDRAAFVQEQQESSRLFDQAAMVFPASSGMRATVVKTRLSWQSGLLASGLWGEQVRALHGDHTADNAAFDTSNENTGELLDSLDVPSHKAMDQGLAHGVFLERILIIALTGLFAVASAVTVYYRRRMAKDLMRPVASMHQGVLTLQAGDYSHRIEVARHDELGELAMAFNGMADALKNSHLALTVRATHDSLTGLANRAALTERLTASFSSGSDRRAEGESLLFIDIDDFKDVNDSMGHEGGDVLLVEMAARFTNCVRAHDLVARIGGDEFAIVVTEDGGGSVAVEIVERILDALRAPFSINGNHLVVTVSIGVAQRSPETGDTAELLRQADFAMYMAKGGGKARCELFDAQMHDDMLARSALKADLAVVAASGQLRVEYQPVVDLQTGEILGVEALVRWQHPALGLLAPAEFIPLAEETGDIDAIGCWVLDTATRQAAGWRQKMAHCHNLWVAVNLSAFQLRNPKSLAAIQRILAGEAAQADKVVIEVTETALAADVDCGIASLDALKGFGIRIAIDDFGTGFSSLSTLASLPVDILKIDRSFVSGQTSATPSVPMLEGILGLADKLSLAVIAEGIEEPEQLDLLRSLGCGMGQGYLLSGPAPAHVVEELLFSSGSVQRGTTAELHDLRVS
jgi:diguanylate cyclase (GGDEF)-like protein